MTVVCRLDVGVKIAVEKVHSKRLTGESISENYSIISPQILFTNGRHIHVNENVDHPLLW